MVSLKLTMRFREDVCIASGDECSIAICQWPAHRGGYVLSSHRLIAVKGESVLEGAVNKFECIEQGPIDIEEDGTNIFEFCVRRWENQFRFYCLLVYATSGILCL